MRKPFNIDFVGPLKVYLCISFGIVFIGLVCNIIFGTAMDVSFKGGTVLSYSYTGAVDLDKVTASSRTVLGNDAIAAFEDINNTKVVTVTLASSISTTQQTDMLAGLQKAFPNNKITLFQSNTLNATMGQMFFIKCVLTIVLASFFLMIYVGLRFRKIGGMSAGAMGLLGLLHDIVVIYFIFIIFRIKLDENFVAVVLAILGSSLNDTVVIFDRIRENRRKLEKTMPIYDVVNKSINQTFTRTINTALCLLVTLAVITVVAVIMHIDSIISFSVPMMFGTVSGFYSTVCLSTPLWVRWMQRKQKKELALKAKKA